MQRRAQRILSGALVIGSIMGASAAHAVEIGEQDIERVAAVRIQVEVPGDAVIPDGIFARLQYWLGARTLQQIHPPIGTELTITASAYAPSVYQTDATPCTTAVGTRVRRGVVASNFLPIGTLLQIDEEFFIVEDRMNPRFEGYYIDIYFPSTQQALEFGRQRLTATIIDYGTPGQPLPGEAETTASKDEQSSDSAQTEENTSLVDRLQVRLQVVGRTISQLIGTRVPADVNRYDIDCLTEE